MSSRGIPRSTVVLAAVVAVLAIVFVVQETLSPRRNTVEIAIGEGTIDRVALSDGARSLLLRQRDGAWVVGEEGYPARGEDVEALIAALTGDAALDVVTTRAAYDEYGLDEPSVRRVVLFSGESEALSIDIGTRAVAGDAVYARATNRREVVFLPRQVDELFSVEADDFRSTEVASIDEERVTRVRVVSGELEELTAQRVRGGDSADGAAEGEPVWAVESGAPWRGAGGDAPGAGDTPGAIAETAGGVLGAEPPPASGAPGAEAPPGGDPLTAGGVPAGDASADGAAAPGAPGAPDAEAFRGFFAELNPLRAQGFPRRSPPASPLSRW